MIVGIVTSGQNQGVCFGQGLGLLCFALFYSRALSISIHIYIYIHTYIHIYIYACTRTHAAYIPIYTHRHMLCQGCRVVGIGFRAVEALDFRV